MASRSSRKIIGGLSQTGYGLLRSLTDEGPLSAGAFEQNLLQVVEDRIALGRAFVDAARLLVASENPLIRRSAASRSYYGAYHVARAAIFAVRRHDEDDHDKIPKAIDSLPDQREPIGDMLKELR